MAQPGKHNDLSDVKGVLVGSYTSADDACGTTVVLCPDGAVGGVDVRGSAPGTRETDLLSPENLVDKVNAVTLCGGSVYGLAAADGVVRWLAAKGWGFPLEEGHVAPIVPAAALFDLGRGASYVPPVLAEWGARACEAAGDGPVEQGAVGAGAGAWSGGVKGGLGSASVVLDSGLTVAALIAVNSLGSVIDPATGLAWELGAELAGEFGALGRQAVKLPPPPAAEAGRNTTIGVVATDAILTKAQAMKVAQMAHDGMGRAIRPAHTMFDGDTLFCVGTGRRALPEQQGFFAAPYALAITEVGAAAADCVARACIHALLNASSGAKATALRDLPRR